MTPSLRDYALLAVLGLCWGSNFLAIKIAVQEIPPATLTLGRLAIAAAILLLVMKAKKLAWPTDGRTWASLATVAVLGNAIPYGLIAASEVHVTSGLAAVLITSTPLLTLVLAHFLTADERLSRRRSAGIALGLAGVVVVVGVDALAGIGGNLWAELALIGAALSYAVNAIVARRMPKTPPLVSAFAATGLAAVVLFPVAVGSDGVALAPPGLAAIGAMLWLGAVSTALAMLVFFILVARAGATFVSLANYLVPLLALSLGGVLLGEEPTWNMLAALALILGGVFLTGGRPRKS